MTITQQDFSDLKHEVQTLSKWIKGNGEEGLASRIATLEVVTSRSESRLLDFIAETRRYREAREKAELIVEAQRKQERNYEKPTQSKKIKNWFVDKVLPSIITAFIMIVLFAVSIVFLPAFDQILNHALGK